VIVMKETRRGSRLVLLDQREKRKGKDPLIKEKKTTTSEAKKRDRKKISGEKDFREKK